MGCRGFGGKTRWMGLGGANWGKGDLGGKTGRGWEFGGQKREGMGIWGYFLQDGDRKRQK